jgi:hypothetical protein
LREELSVAEQLRDRLSFRTAKDSAVFRHYDEALEALGRVSIALGTAVALPLDAVDRGPELEGR